MSNPRRHRLFIILASGLPLSLLHAATPVPNDSINTLTRTQVGTTARTDNRTLAYSIFDNGGFQGFQAAPGHSMSGSEPVIDFMTQSVVVDQNDTPTDLTPLDDFPADHSMRNIRLGEQLPYFQMNADYPDKNPNERHHRYAIPFADGYDGKGNIYPIVAGIRDMTPSNNSGEYNTVGLRDLVSMVGIFPEYACYMGACIPRKDGYSTSHGAGYSNSAVKGMARFAHPLFPNPVPSAQGSLWYASVFQKTTAIAEENLGTFAEHQNNFLAVQLVFGKRLKHAYGPRDNRTKALDTIVAALGINGANTIGDGIHPNRNPSGTELIYATKEFGYATRWEMWSSDPAKIVNAPEWYEKVGPPANLKGKYSDHFEIGPLIDDPVERAYKHKVYITNPDTGAIDTQTWYLVGGHDYTYLQRRDANNIPIDPETFAPPSRLNPYYIRYFSVDHSTANWTGGVSSHLDNTANWDRSPRPEDYLKINTPSLTVTLTDSTNLRHQGMDLAYSSNSRADLSLTNATLTLNGHLIAADNTGSRANITLQNASLSSNYILTALQRTSNAGIILSGSTLAAGIQLHIANNGSATLQADDSNLYSEGSFLTATQNQAASTITLGNSTLGGKEQFLIAENGTATLTLNDRSILASYSTDTRSYIANSTRANATLTIANSTLHANRLTIANTQGSRAQLILDNASVNNSTLYTSASIVFAENGTLVLGSSGNSSVQANDLIFSNSTHSNVTITLGDNSTFTTNRYSYYGRNGTTNATLSENASLHGRLDIHLAQYANGNALLTLGDNATVNAQRSLFVSALGNTRITLTDQAALRSTANTVFGQGRTLIHIIPTSPLRDSPYISARLITLESATPPSINLDLSRLPLPRYNTDETITLPLIRTTQSISNPRDILLDTLNYNPNTHQISYEWNSANTQLTATIRSLIPPPHPYNNEEELLLYALTDNYTTTPSGNLITTPSGSTDHLPKIVFNENDGTHTVTFTPLRPGLIYEIQHSTDLENWSTIESIQGNASLSEPISRQFPSNTPSLFLRLKITPYE